jgi:hypothetical protein
VGSWARDCAASPWISLLIYSFFAPQSKKRIDRGLGQLAYWAFGRAVLDIQMCAENPHTTRSTSTMLPQAKRSFVMQNGATA